MLFGRVESDLGDLVRFVDDARSSWYRFDDKEIPIVSENDGSIVSLSSLSSVVRGLQPVQQKRIYIANTPDARREADQAIERIRAEERR